MLSLVVPKLLFFIKRMIHVSYHTEVSLLLRQAMYKDPSDVGILQLQYSILSLFQCDVGLPALFLFALTHT